MITELTGLVGDNVCVSPSLFAEAAFVCSPAKPLKSTRMTRNLLRLAESLFRMLKIAQTSTGFSCGAVDLVDGVFAHGYRCEIITEGAVW